MGDKNILAELHGHQAEQAEFEELVSSFFGHGTEISDTEIIYGRGLGLCALKLTYDKKGLLAGVYPGPELLDGDIEALRKRIDAELVSPGSKRVGRRVLFAGVPVDGWFRYKDTFQIIPVPKDAPRPKFLLADHPFVLEVGFQSSPHGMTSLKRRDRIAREVELLCSAFFPTRVRAIGSMARHHWTLELSEDGQYSPSSYRQEEYAWPGMVPEQADFTRTDEIPRVVVLDPKEFYARQGITASQTLDLPADFSRLVDSFYQMAPEARDAFLRASYWFQHSANTFSKSRSAAFIALVSAIEALMPDPTDVRRCDTCKQALGSGPTERFAQFVEAFIPDSLIPKSERKEFYRLRSALAHGGKLLESDHTHWGFTPRSIEEHSTMTRMWQIVRLVFHAWLLQANE